MFGLTSIGSTGSVGRTWEETGEEGCVDTVVEVASREGVPPSSVHSGDGGGDGGRDGVLGTEEVSSGLLAYAKGWRNTRSAPLTPSGKDEDGAVRWTVGRPPAAVQLYILLL